MKGFIFKLFFALGLSVALGFAINAATMTTQMHRDAAFQVVQGSTGNSYVDGTSSAKTVTTLDLTSNVVTITTSAAHGYAVGETVTVAVVTNAAVCNGTFVITTVGSATTFTYAKVHADILTGVETGTVTGFYESPIAAGTTLVALKWPANAIRLFVTTSAVCAIQPSSTTIAPGTSGSYNTVAATIYELYGKPGDTTYIVRTNSSTINFRFGILQ